MLFRSRLDYLASARLGPRVEPAALEPTSVRDRAGRSIQASALTTLPGDTYTYTFDVPAGSTHELCLEHSAPKGSNGTEPATPHLERQRRSTLLWTAFVTLLLLWCLGIATSITLSGFIHVLLLIAAAVAVAGTVKNRELI